MSNDGKYGFAIDRGGTFTDILCICPGGETTSMKLLSDYPSRYADAPTEGIRRILKEKTGVDLTKSGLVDSSKIKWIRMGTTVATNALLERKGDPCALVVNKGFRDLLYIGNQARPNIFDLNIRKPSNLYEKVVEIDCRIVPEQNGLCELEQSWRILKGSGSNYLEMKSVNVDEVRAALLDVRKQGISSIAVVLNHSYVCPKHEIEVGEIAKEIGFENIILSHEAMSMCRVVPRGYTACAEAYLTPHVTRYLASFKSGFEGGLVDVDVLFMQSDGGLTRMDNFRAARAILSGPAGGVVGYAMTGSRETDSPLIGFDMGGTSTDVSRFSGTYEHVIESTTAGVTIQAPQLDINTVAAGGGSMLFFRSGLFVVGPESAGANPGPTCYKKGGPLTVTDANLILGRILPEYFPKIFGPNENEPLDYNATKAKFECLQKEINQYLTSSGDSKQMSIEDIAQGFIRVANEAMCRPIRALTQARGFDTSQHVLACFGGAGGQHACSIARHLGIKKVLVHKYAGILSAYGMALADVVQEIQEPCDLEFSTTNSEVLKRRIDGVQKKCHGILLNQGYDDIHLETFLHMRYEGTDCALMCSPSANSQIDMNVLTEAYGDFLSTFMKRYRTEFGFVLENRRIIIDDIRIRGLGKIMKPIELESLKSHGESPTPITKKRIYFEEGAFESPVFRTEQLKAGQKIAGPALLIDQLSTILIEAKCIAEVTSYGDLVINIDSNRQLKGNTNLDAVQLSIFSHRFMSIAEQMGRVLQRTSISTNIKERLDFSCALFGPDGGLVSNAPHIPVHLGAMQETVQYQIKVRGTTLKNGDVILSNHPQAGGSHLPDLTVITPVFHQDQSKPVFFVASRGHHADIGGITPGSMPPHSTSLSEEGTAFKSFLIVQNGVFQEEKIIEKLSTPTNAKGAKGSRNITDNVSDLKAQIAANQKGIHLVSELIEAYTLEVVQAYMGYIQQNAECAVRDMLKQIGRDTFNRTGCTILKAEEFMDDGSPIRVQIEIDIEKGSALCDFSGSGHEVWGNCNAPRAVTISALIYCLRCMVGHDIPLNQGCLTPMKVIIPKNSILDPSSEAAVVGGNVLTSQRVVDTILKAFRVCAASQGCMNNITLGDEKWGYYETVAGGSGAGPLWHGAGGVHTHMTNTRITDPEILELRYPIILKRFCLRDDQSGGNGQFVGGEGVMRELLFRKPLTLSVLTERRTLRPYGMAGGHPGKCGLNLLYKHDGRIISLGAKKCIEIETGDSFFMKTPGGGGYGESECVSRTIDESKIYRSYVERGSVFDYRQAQESV